MPWQRTSGVATARFTEGLAPTDQVVDGSRTSAAALPSGDAEEYSFNCLIISL